MKKILITSVSLYFIFTSALAQRVCGPEFALYGLEGKTFEEALDQAGVWHNEYQVHMLNFFISEKSVLHDTNDLKVIIYQESVRFFNDKGLNYNSIQFPMTFGFPISQFTFPVENCSEDAFSILVELNGLINSYDPVNDSTFFIRLNELKGRALILEDDKEVFLTGLPVTIALNSYPFWKNEGQRYLELLSDEGDNEPDAGSGPLKKNFERVILKKCKLQLGSLAGTDVGGAVSGASAGTVLGPGGAFAGAVLVSASSSLANITTQVIGCLFNWW